MNKNLFVSDLDGTLLKDKAILSEFSRTNLNQLIQKGLQFTVASARSVISMQKILHGLELKLPIIEFNGAFISDLKTGEHLIINEIKPDIKNEILEIINKHGQIPFISSFDGKKDLLYYTKIQNQGCNWYLNDRVAAKDNRLKKVEFFNKVINEHIICFTIIDVKDKLLNLSYELESIYSNKIELHLIENNYSPGWYWLTIHDSKATKDQAIKELVKNTGHKLDDLIVFGDNANDIKMFKSASKSIAVNNAKDILKSYADEIIGTNNDDSVIKYIINNIKDRQSII